MTSTFARLLVTQRKCDCGARARYRLDIAIGGHNDAHDVRTDSLYLCPACYIVHLEMEIERLSNDYAPSASTLTDLCALIRRYIRLEQAAACGLITEATPRVRHENVDQARRILDAVERTKVCV